VTTPGVLPVGGALVQRFSPSRFGSCLCAFRIRPWRYIHRELRPKTLESRFYWNVLVFPDLRTLRRYVEWRTGEPAAGCRAAAQVSPLPIVGYRKGMRPRVHSRLGEALFARGHIGTEIVSHEAVHIATSTLRAVELQATGNCTAKLLKLTVDIDNGEERLAYMIGSCARQLVAAFYDAKLYGRRRAA
jgi:hypothetical protein